MAFLYSIRDGFSPYASDTIQLLVSCLDESKTTNEQVSKRVLSAFSIIGVYAIELLYIIVPFICNAILCEQTLNGVRISALETLANLVKTVDLYQYLGPVMRAVTFGLHYDDKVTKGASYELLYALFLAQGSNFLDTAIPIIEDLKKSNMITPQLQNYINDAQNQKHPFKFYGKGGGIAPGLHPHFPF